MMMKINNPTVVVCGINADKVPLKEEITVWKCEKDEIADLLNTAKFEMLIVSEDVFRKNKETILSAMKKDNVVVITDRQFGAGIKTVRSVESTRKMISVMINEAKEQLEVFKKTTEILNEFGITSNLRGKAYLRFAICSVVRNENLINSMVKKLYVHVAEEYDITASRAERCTRFAIQTGWKRATSEVKQKYFGSLQDIPTNSEFIANIAERIRYETIGFFGQ